MQIFPAACITCKKVLSADSSKMVYIDSSGQVVSGRAAGLSLGTIPDMFWALVNFIVLFFRTLIHPDLTSKGRGCDSTYRAGPGGGPPPGPRRRMGGFGNRGSGPSSPPMGGGG